MKNTKILIIKLGYSETLDSEIGRIPSLGDVLRTTPILWALKEKYPDSYITWLVDKHAESILHNNKFIERVLIWDDFVPFQLIKEKFDVLINLEKIPGVCALTDMIDAWVKYGFRFESINGTYHGYENGLNFIEYIDEKKKANRPNSLWQQILIEMLGVEWKRQEYVIGYKPKAKDTYDVGLNYQVGSKWTNKALPMDKWRELEKKLTFLGYTISWQQGKKHLLDYMDWINSCRLIISNDSLGLHMAFAFKKKTIGLFGPTDPKEIYFYGDSKIISADQECECMPCYKSACESGLKCMESIKVDKISAATEEMLKKEISVSV